MTPPGDLDDGGRTSTHPPQVWTGTVRPAGHRDRDKRSPMRGLADPAGPTTGQAREMLEVAKLGAQAAMARGPDVDDVAQTVAEKLIRKWNAPHVADARARGTHGWQAYIAVAARNAYRDLLRKRERARNREARATNLSEGAALRDRPGVKRSRPGEVSDVDRYLGRRMLVDLLWECPMTAGQRAVAALHLIDGMTTADIADRLVLPAPTVARRRRHALQILRRELLARSGTQDLPA